MPNDFNHVSRQHVEIGPSVMELKPEQRQRVARFITGQKERQQMEELLPWAKPIANQAIGETIQNGVNDLERWAIFEQLIAALINEAENQEWRPTAVAAAFRDAYETLIEIGAMKTYADHPELFPLVARRSSRSPT